MILNSDAVALGLMSYDSEDEAGWNALPSVSEEKEESLATNIGPLHTGSQPYIYRLQCDEQLVLTLASQPAKVMPSK